MIQRVAPKDDLSMAYFSRITWSR